MSRKKQKVLIPGHATLCPKESVMNRLSLIPARIARAGRVPATSSAAS